MRFFSLKLFLFMFSYIYLYEIPIEALLVESRCLVCLFIKKKNVLEVYLYNVNISLERVHAHRYILTDLLYCLSKDNLNNYFLWCMLTLVICQIILICYIHVFFGFLVIELQDVFH